jgi:iron complex outermembrane receptor protein
MGLNPTVAVMAAALSTTSTFALAQAAAPTVGKAADGSSVSLEEVVVTATKREENLQNVPVSVAALSASTLTKEGVFETTDLNRTIPNFQVSSPYGKQQPNFSVRGVGVGTEFNANAASPVGVYVDEVYQAFRASHGQQLYDLNQVEVVRGPQGTLYGRNTTGGAINFITKAPKLAGEEGYLSVGYGNYNRFAAEGAFETTPIDDRFGVRIAGTYVNSDPYIKNILPAGVNRSVAGGASGLNLDSGKSPGGAESIGVRLSARFKPFDTVDLGLKVYYGDSRGGTEAPIPVGQSKSSDVISYTNPNFLLAPLFQALGPTGLVPTSYSRSALGLGKLDLQLDTVGDAYTLARGAVFDAHIDLADGLKFVAITGYDNGKYQQSSTDCDGTPLRLCAIGYGSVFNAFNQDARLDYAHGPIKLIGGVYYGRDEVTSDNRPDFFNFLRDINAAVGSPAGYFNPGGAFGALLPAGSLPTGITALQHFRQIRTSYAVYGEGSYQITSDLKVTGGLRYTSDKNDFRDGLTTYYDDTGVARLITVSDFKQGGAFAPYFLQPVRNQAGAIVVPSYPSLGIPLPGGLSNSGKSGRFSGRVIVDYKPSETSLLFASYSRGYRAGTFNGLAYGSANQVYFVQPETVDAYEAGFKSRWIDNRLQINGSVFYYDYKGQQGQVVDATATANLVSFDGRLDGLELETQFAATQRLTLTASFGLLNTKYADGACPGTPVTGFPAQIGSCVVSSGGPVSVGGNPFPFAAKSSVNLGFDWDVAEIGPGKLTLFGDAAYTGRFYYDAFKDYSRPPLNKVSTGPFGDGEGDYWVVNGRLSYNVGRYTVSAWVKNLTDTTYYPFGISLENLFGNGYRVRAEPRTFGVEAKATF